MGLLMVWSMALSILVLYSVLYICCVLIIFRPSKANDFLLKLMIFCLLAGGDSTYYIPTTSFCGNVIV